jgi:hypothetical protein
VRRPDSGGFWPSFDADAASIIMVTLG